MRYLAICLLFTATLFFSKNSSSKTPPEPQKSKSEPLTFRTAIPPVASYLSLKLLSHKTEFDISAETRLAEEAGTIALTQTGLSKFTAEKIARCSIAAVINLHSSLSPSSGIKTVGKTFLSELILDEVENYLSIIPYPNMENNVLFQSGKFVAKSIARHYLDKELDNMGEWYPVKNFSPLDISLDEKHSNLNEKYFNFYLTHLIRYASTKFIAKKLVQATGKNTYVHVPSCLSADQLPLITANDVAAATVTGITFTAFSGHDAKKTAKLIGKEFIVNKITATELGIFKKYWHHGIKNYHAITKINEWGHNHPKIVGLLRDSLQKSASLINNILLEKLLCSISQSSND